MEVDVLNMNGEKVRSIELPPAIFEAPVNVALMHQALVRQLANARLGTHDTKTRGEVSGGGRKPWRQKGTGRARQGSSRSPIWRGGGGAHTPHPHKYTQAMPRKMRQAALRSALSDKANNQCIVVLEELAIPEPKTRIMAKSLDLIVGQAVSALVLIPDKETAYADVIRAANNLPDVKVLLTGYLNIRDIMRFDKVILPLPALEAVAAHLG